MVPVEESAVFLIRMPEDIYTERPLFGGAIASTFPVRFQVSLYICIVNYPTRVPVPFFLLVPVPV